MLETESSDHQDEVGAMFRQGKIGLAIEACSAKLRSNPGDLGARLLLAELLLLAGNLERADTILDAATRMEPTVAVTVAEFRQLLRADIARRQLDSTGRMPEFLGEPTPTLRALLAARVALRAGDSTEAARCAGEAERQRPRVPGRLGDSEFDDWRDVDDLCTGVFEILTTTGKYYWIPTERVESVEFVTPQRPRDLAWRRANVSVFEGPDGTVYLPAIYTSEDPDLADTMRLGRATEWRELNSGVGDSLVRGVGLRTFLAGDEAHDIMGLTTLSFVR
jgi:type VI secretion system protein ImpE